MNNIKLAGLGILVILWIWMAVAILRVSFDLYHVLIVAISGIIIFVPLMRKFLKNN